MVVGWTTSTLYYVVVRDDDGSVWVGDHEYPPADWMSGRGPGHLVSHSLKAFVKRLADERGRWWWEAG